MTGMASKTVKIKFCDICGREEDVRSYRIAFADRGQMRSLDLCAEHAEPLEALRVAMGDGKRSSIKPRQVVTREQARRR